MWHLYKRLDRLRDVTEALYTDHCCEKAEGVYRYTWILLLERSDSSKINKADFQSALEIKHSPWSIGRRLEIPGHSTLRIEGGNLAYNKQSPSHEKHESRATN